MRIEGKIIDVLPLKKGTSEKGDWMAQEYVIEYIEHGRDKDYTRHCAFEVMGEENINRMGIGVGQDLDVDITVDARKYNGRWYNQLRAWRAILRNHGEMVSNE